MAGMRRSWTIAAATAVLLVSAGQAAQAQSALDGALSGKITDLYSTPLAGATVTVHNQLTGAEARTVTQRNGAYRLTGLGPGAYSLTAESPQLGHGHMEGILVVAGHEARVQLAMQLEPLPVQPVPKLVHLAVVGIATEALPLAAFIDAEPLSALALNDKEILDRPREVPRAQAEALNAPPEPPSPAGAMPPARNSKPQVAVAESRQTTARLVLAGAGAPGDGSAVFGALGQFWSGGYGFAAGVVAMSVLRSAMEFAQPVPRAAKMAASEPDPAAPVTASTTSGDQLQALPASGRRWQDFVLDAPPPAGAADAETDSVPHAGSQREPSVSVDGANRELAFGDLSGGWAWGRGTGVSEASIREVQNAAGTAAAASERVNLETRRGANGFHGQAFLFDRQNNWGAQNPFTQWVKETAPATLTSTPVFTPEAYTPPDHETAWGVGMGRQIRRNKLFWFAAADGSQRNDPGLATVKYPDEFFAQPSNDQMQVLSARLGLSNSNPVAAGLAAYSNLLETLGGLLGPEPRIATQWTGFGRIDWIASERNSFTLEGTGSLWNSPGGGLTRTEEPYGNHSFGTSRASEEWLLARWEAFLTPNLLAVTQGSAGRTIESTQAETPSTFEQTMVQTAWNQLPQMVVDSRYGFTIGNPSRFGPGSYPDEHLYQAQETVDWVRGGLLVKAGFDLSHNYDATSLLRNQTGTYTYSSVENFASDALAYAAYGLAGSLNPTDPHNCDQTGKVWRDSSGTLRGLGSFPCYSYYSQLMGPSDWWLSTNQWAGFGTIQWQPKKRFVLSAGLRWEREQLPAPISELNNNEVPLTQKLPSLGNNWGPRFSLAWGGSESHWPVLRLGYGMYFDRVQNAVVETALTQTGSPNGDMNFFMRPTDNLNGGGAPPFPYVLFGEPLSMVKPNAVEFAPGFHNSEIHQAVAGVEESLPGHVQVTANALVSLGRRLPVSIDTNFDPAVNPGTITYAVVDGTGAGPIKSAEITVPFYATWPSANSATGTAGRLNNDYQQITEIMSRANSTYEAATLRINRYGRRGLTLHAHYTYAHAMDWNPNQSAQVAGSDVLDPEHFSQEYGTSDLDVRHSAAIDAVWEAPWKLHGAVGGAANGWTVSGVGQFRSGLPFTMRTSGSLAQEFAAQSGAAIVALGPGMNGSGGDNRVYGVGRNTYRYPQTWKADLRLGKRFELGRMRQLELLAESFNLFNHQNVTEVETVGYYVESGSLAGGFPTLNFLTGLKANTTAFGQPLNVNATNFYRERQIQFGVRLRF